MQIMKFIHSLKLWFRARYWLSSACVVLSGRDRESKRYLRSVHDRYKGQRCFVIGNGPSLVKEDLEKLSGEVTFASNRIYNIFSQTDWRPTYYGMLDEVVAKSDGVIQGASTIDCKMKFFRRQGYYLYGKIKGPACYIRSWWGDRYVEEPAFSTDMCKGFYCIATVTYMLVQIAVWMGFSEIYFIGMDNKYAKTLEKDGTVTVNQGLNSYFAGGKVNASSGATETWKLDAVYDFLEAYSRKAGFRVYNATRGGYLEKFERVDLDEVLSRPKNG